MKRFLYRPDAGSGRLLLFLVCLVMACVPCDRCGAQESPGLSANGVSPLFPHAIPNQGDVSISEPERPSRWFMLPALINVYPKLESETLIRRYFNPAMRAVAPGFENVRTISSMRDEHLLWVPDAAFGYVVSPRWALYLHFGYSGGKVRTKADNTSLLVLPLHTDFEIYRSSAYIGLCADVFPWGMPERRTYVGLGERLRNIRPSIGFRLTENYAGYKVKAKAGLTNYTHFLNLDLEEHWWVTTYNMNIGVDIPVNADNALVLNAGYNISFSRGYDFDGTAFTVGWKHYFK
ncbi:MAG TPA: hypothetical protein PKO23_13340 [Candidatus Hydrogenedentes bacterium]|jgi:hypothetical protein|nr:hypothetical protein [Candidatus Hydrogenedentota bacterium]